MVMTYCMGGHIFSEYFPVCGCGIPKKTKLSIPWTTEHATACLVIDIVQDWSKDFSSHVNYVDIFPTSIFSKNQISCVITLMRIMMPIKMTDDNLSTQVIIKFEFVQRWWRRSVSCKWNSLPTRWAITQLFYPNTPFPTQVPSFTLSSQCFQPLSPTVFDAMHCHANETSMNPMQKRRAPGQWCIPLLNTGSFFFQIK